MENRKADYRRTERRLEEAEVRLCEKAQVEAALRESAEKYRTRLDTMAEGFCAVEVLRDEEGRAVDVRVLELNLAFEQQTGIKHDQLVGRRLFEVPPLEDARRWMTVWARVADTGEPPKMEDYAALVQRFLDLTHIRRPF